MVISLERGADLHMAQLMPLPLTVSCFCEIQIRFTFLAPAHPGSPGQRAVKRVCVCYYETRKSNWSNTTQILSYVSVQVCIFSTLENIKTSYSQLYLECSHLDQLIAVVEKILQNVVH